MRFVEAIRVTNRRVVLSAKLVVMDRRWVGVGVGAVIRRGDDVLLLKRRNVHGDGTWSTPGGHVEFGESLERCAAREAQEETGLVAGEVSFLAVTNDYMPEDGKHYVTERLVHGHALGGRP